jgi:hypothetical protein
MVTGNLLNYRHYGRADRHTTQVVIHIHQHSQHRNTFMQFRWWLALFSR